MNGISPLAVRPWIAPSKVDALLVVSLGELALAVFKLAEDVAVAAAYIVRHPPHVDSPAAAEDPNVNGRGVRVAGVAAPFAAVAEDGQAADVDVDAFRHVDVDVAAPHQDGHGPLPPFDGGLA